MNMRPCESIRVPHPASGILHVHLSHSNQPLDWAVLYVHGFGSRQSGEKALALEEACARRGWTFVSFDFRGHGESTGNMLELRGSGLLEDLAVVRDYLAGRGIGRMCLVGSSMGGWAASWFALRHPEVVAGLALIAPALEFPRSFGRALTDAERQEWKKTGRLRVSNQFLSTEIGHAMEEDSVHYPVDVLRAGLARPVLIFHGMMDDIVSFQSVLHFVQGAVSANMELRLYKDGDHRLLAKKNEMAEAACDFFGRCCLC